MSYESTLFEYIEMIKSQVRALPLNLGGMSTTSGVSPYGPPGGYVGYLPQYRVSYDSAELAVNTTPASGVSIIDNLNHIRYRVTALEGGSGTGGSALTVSQDGTTIATGVSIIDFVGATVSVITDGTRVTISGGGSSHDPVTINDTSTVDLSLTGQLLSAAVIPAGIKLDDLGTPDDNLDLNASTTYHGLLPRLPNDATKYINGVGIWATVSGMTHNSLNSIQGGTSGQYYHLTSAELSSLSGIGSSSNKIMLLDSGNTVVATYAATGSGLASAVAAASSGDTIQLPVGTITISAGSIVIDSGVTLRGLGWGSILSGVIGIRATTVLENFKLQTVGAGPIYSIEHNAYDYAYLRNMYIYSESTDDTASSIYGSSGNLRAYDSVFAIYPYTGSVGSVFISDGGYGNFYHCEAFGVAEPLTYWGDYLPDLHVFHGVKDEASYVYP